MTNNQEIKLLHETTQKNHLKKMAKIYFLTLLLIMLIPSRVYSQINVSGQIKNQNSKPVELVEIQLKDKDSIIIKSELTNSEGKFTIITEKGDFQLLIKQLGKILLKQRISINQDINIGIIQVTENQQQLQEVIVTSRKKLIERKVDRLIFNVENSISASGGDAIDALKITPSIRVQNDQIMMIGKSAMGIMINDRLIQLSGDDLLNYLKNIKSDDIKKIEVITNPPAKYDAQGNSGLVNIITKSAKKNSYNGSIRSSLSQSEKSIGRLGLNLNYQKEKLTMTTNINYSNGSTAPFQRYTLTYPTFLWIEENNKLRYINDISGGYTIDYKISNKTKIGIEYTTSKNLPLMKIINNSSVYKRNLSSLDSIIKNEARLKMKNITHSFNFYSVTELDTLGKKINFDIDYIKYDASIDNSFNTNSFYADNTQIPNRYLSANNFSNQKINIITSKLDFEFPTKWANLTFGTKITIINNNSEVSFFNLTSGSNVFDSSKSNLFNYKENIQALYFSGSKKITKKIEIQIGLRGENTQTIGFSKTLNKENLNDYFKIFPTLFINYMLNDYKTLSFNYNKRIDRPAYSDLNPFRFYTSSFNYAEGNPFLQPYFSDNVELSYVYKDLYTSLYVNRKQNGFDQVTYVEPTNNIQIVKPNNFYNQTSFGLFEGYSFNVKYIWENNSNISIFYSKTISNLPDVVPGISGWSSSLNSQNTFILDKAKKYKAEIGFMYQSPTVAGSYDLSSYYDISAGLKVNFLNNKLQVSISAVDIFKTNKQTFTQTVNNIKQENYDYIDVRRVRFSLVYNFGQKFDIVNKQKSNTEEKGRIQ